MYGYENGDVMIEKCCKCGKEIKEETDGFRVLGMSEFICYDCAEKFVSTFKVFAEMVKTGVLKFGFKGEDANDD